MEIWYRIAYTTMWAYLILCPVILLAIDGLLGMQSANRERQWRLFVGQLALLEYRMVRTVDEARAWMNKPLSVQQPMITGWTGIYWTALRRQVDASVKISMDHLKGCVGDLR